MALPAIGSWVVVPQKRLGVVGLMALLVISSFMTPISLDMYTPAVPYMSGYFNTSPDMVNFTLSGFFVFYTVGMLIFGPISDRYGRRKGFLCSFALYFVGSLACAMSPTIEVFIAARLLQGLGAGGATTIGMAVVKDAFDPEHRGAVLGIMQVLFVIGPVVAPLLGALIISAFGWRMSFWALTVVAGVSLVLSGLFEETIPEDGWVSGSFGQVAGRLVSVSKNKGFVLFLCLAAMIELSFMAYIAVASYIYMDMFGLGEIGYSVCFSAAAVVGIIGPVIDAKLLNKAGTKLFTLTTLCICVIAGVLLLSVARIGFLAFCVISMIVPVAQACVRPYSTNILLDQHKNDTGSASAVISFVRGVLGSVGMLAPLLPWPDYLTALGSITAIAAIAGIAMWVLLMRSRLPLIGVKGEEPTKLW